MSWSAHLINVPSSRSWLNRLRPPSCRATVPYVEKADDLAADLGLDEGDVRVLLRQLGEQTPDMPDELATFLRQTFDPNGERTAPPGLYWPGADDEHDARVRAWRPRPDGNLRSSASLVGASSGSCHDSRTRQQPTLMIRHGRSGGQRRSSWPCTSADREQQLG